MNDHEHDRDPELNATEDVLDRLGHTDRGAPDDGFEQRVLSAVRDEVLAPAPLSIEHARRAWWHDRALLAAAASVAVVGAVAMLIWSSAPSAGPGGNAGGAVALTPVEEVDQLIETVAWLREDLPDLAALEQRAETIGTTDESLWDQAEQTLLDTEESI